MLPDKSYFKLNYIKKKKKLYYDERAGIKLKDCEPFLDRLPKTRGCLKKTNKIIIKKIIFVYIKSEEFDMDDRKNYAYFYNTYSGNIEKLVRRKINNALNLKFAWC